MKPLQKQMNPESMLKGRMAETLFEELMRNSGNMVYRFGYESIVQNLAHLEEKFDRYNEVGDKIRSIPDFIVLDRDGMPTLVEVKFRFKPELHKNDFKKIEIIDKFWKAKLVLVNCWEQPYFRIANPPYIKKDEKLVLTPLIEEKNWKIDKKIYDEFETLVHKYLTPTLVPHKK